MKAWLVRETDGECSTVIFAETRGKARSMALATDCCEDAKFTDIEVYRQPQIDKYYKDGKYAGEKKYYLVETKTLDGYTLDKTEHEVVFAYKDDSTPIVEVTFDLTNDKPEVPQTTEGTPGTPSAGNPKTGDETNLWLPVMMLAVSVSGIAGLG